MPVGQRSRWRMAPPRKWAPPARRPGSVASNQRPCGTPGAAGVTTGKCSDSFSILLGNRNMRPAKEKKGTANRKVSGSGTGQTLKGKPQGRRWDGTSPATMAARREEGVRFFGRTVFGWCTDTGEPWTCRIPRHEARIGNETRPDDETRGGLGTAARQMQHGRYVEGEENPRKAWRFRTSILDAPAGADERRGGAKHADGVQAPSPARRCPGRTGDEKPQAPGVAAKVEEDGPDPTRSYVDGDIARTAQPRGRKSSGRTSRASGWRA
jgi:hypothetical protein